MTAALLLCSLFGQSLDEVDSLALRRYLDELGRGGPARADLVERFADPSWANLRLVCERYCDLETPVEPATHRAFQTLLERGTRTAVGPWPLVETYSPEFAEFLSTPLDRNELSARLFRRLLDGATDLRSWDLIVRLTPEASLRHLATESQDESHLFYAWNRRLARGRETRPIANRERGLKAIAERAAKHDRVSGNHLEFLGRWPETTAEFDRLLLAALRSESPDVVRTALRVQQKLPRHVDRNAELIRRFRDTPSVVEETLKSFAADGSGKHSGTLRELWPHLPEPPSRARYLALIAMAVHPPGNEQLALEALMRQPFEFLDAALGVLQHGPDAPAREAVEFLLRQSSRGHEEALRLAIQRRLRGFERPAWEIAANEKRDAIARQTALRYLPLADGTWRRRIAPLLGHRNGDVRLAAIQAIGPPDGLTPADRDELGPHLIRVAQADASEGHRQEAMHALGLWRDPNAAPFFRQVVEQHPAVILADQPFSDAVYWRYRLRLVALLGLARLDDRPARAELVELHRRGGPTERMDVLLAWLSLGVCPDDALGAENLTSTEPKLLATLTRLVLDHGRRAQRRRLRDHFQRTSLWAEFRDSGVDDHNLLHMVEELGNEAR